MEAMPDRRAVQAASAGLLAALALAAVVVSRAGLGATELAQAAAKKGAALPVSLAHPARRRVSAAAAAAAERPLQVQVQVQPRQRLRLPRRRRRLRGCGRGCCEVKDALCSAGRAGAGDARGGPEGDQEAVLLPCCRLIHPAGTRRCVVWCARRAHRHVQPPSMPTHGTPCAPACALRAPLTCVCEPPSCRTRRASWPTAWGWVRPPRMRQLLRPGR